MTNGEAGRSRSSRHRYSSLLIVHHQVKSMEMSAAVGKQLRQEAERIERVDRAVAGQPRSSGFPHLGLRARQITLITALVAFVVLVATIINTATLTSVIVNRTQSEAIQV